MVAHAGFIEEGRAIVIPLSYYYDPGKPDKLFVHGSIKSRALEHLTSGEPVCVTVTLTDGLVYSRKAMNHSMNYRSVILFGHGKAIEGEAEKYEVFDRMVERYFPGRKAGQDYDSPPSTDLGITSLAEIKIEEWSAKARRGGPTGPDDDNPGAPGSAGVIDLREV
jgi:nitroimidazol reductase NimA-like FMN-containing flavoprotein (pyridoxamine 5'-phosphate oxidase superfamily)